MDGNGRTLRSRHTQLADPPIYRRGITQLLPIANPAAGSNALRQIPGDYWERPLTFSGQFAASASAAARGLAFQVQTGDGTPVFSTPVADIVSASQTVNFYGALSFPGITEFAAAQSFYGLVASPAANTAIAQSGSLPPGTYQVAWEVELAGTLTELTDNDNFRLLVNGSSVAISVNPAIAGAYPQEPVEVTLSVASAISLKNILAGTAASDYSGSITITPLDEAGASFCIPDLVLQSGWYCGVVAANILAGDQFSNLNTLLERYASNDADGQYELDTESMLRRVIREEFNNQW